MHHEQTTADDENEIETIRNEERGCGFISHGKAYLRSGVPDPDGELPAFVEFDPYIPYLERSKFRGYEFFPGIGFELAVTGGKGLAGANAPRDENGRPEYQSPAEVEATGPFADLEGVAETDPAGEVWRHISRMVGTADGTHAGEITAFGSHDLYMHVGMSYYEEPEDFIGEVRTQGLSKAIPVSESQGPPRINPGRTRLFLVHPRAVPSEEGENKPGVIGYCYLSRTIFTETAEGEFPQWAQKRAGAGELDLVRIGEHQIYEDGTVATRLDDDEDSEEDEDAVDEEDREPLDGFSGDVPEFETLADPSSPLDVSDVFSPGSGVRVDEETVEEEASPSLSDLDLPEEVQAVVEDAPPLDANALDDALRGLSYNDLRSVCSSAGIRLQNPSMDDMVLKFAAYTKERVE